MNGLKVKKDLTDDQRRFIALVEDKNLGGLILELVKAQLAEEPDFSKRDRILEKVIKIAEITLEHQDRKDMILLNALKELKNDGPIRSEEIS